MTPTEVLVELLCARFGPPSRLRDFVRELPGGEALARAVAFEQMAPVDAARRVVEVLVAAGRVDGGFFDELCRRFPRVEAKIRDVQRTWHRLVLFMTATPAGSPELAVASEARWIREAIVASFGADQTALVERHHVGPSDWQRELELVRPWVVHFSGHGNALGRLVLEGDSGGATDLPYRPMLRQLVRVGVGGVVFSACHSDRLGRAAVDEGVPWAIGMFDPIADDVAVQFARAFYGAIAMGRPPRESFALALESSEWLGLKRPHNPRFFGDGGRG